MLLCAQPATAGQGRSRAGQGRRLCAPQQRRRPPWACRRGGGTPPGWPCRPSAGWRSPAGSPGCGCGGGGPLQCRWWGPAWRGCPPPAARKRWGGTTLVEMHVEGQQIAWCAGQLGGGPPLLRIGSKPAGWVRGGSAPEAWPQRCQTAAPRRPAVSGSTSYPSCLLVLCQPNALLEPSPPLLCQLSCCCPSRHASTAFRARKPLQLQAAQAPKCCTHRVQWTAGEQPGCIPHAIVAATLCCSCRAPCWPSPANACWRSVVVPTAHMWRMHAVHAHRTDRTAAAVRDHSDSRQGGAVQLFVLQLCSIPAPGAPPG